MALAGCAAAHDSAKITAARVASHIPMRLARGRGDSKAFLSRFVGFGCVIIRAVLARNALIYSLVIPPCVPRDLSGAIFFSGAGNLVDRVSRRKFANTKALQISAPVPALPTLLPISTAHGITFIANSGDFHAIDIAAPT
jgi:hypothetical protein